MTYEAEMSVRILANSKQEARDIADAIAKVAEGIFHRDIAWVSVGHVE